MLDERDNDPNEAIDPPDNSGGGGGAISLDAPDEEAMAIDPPDNSGGGH